MRTTLNLPDTMVAEAKIRAINEGTTLTALLVEGLKDRLTRGSPIRRLPVSRAGGGLLQGIDWSTLESSDGKGEDYR